MICGEGFTRLWKNLITYYIYLFKFNDLLAKQDSVWAAFNNDVVVVVVGGGGGGGGGRILVSPLSMSLPICLSVSPVWLVSIL